MVAAPGRLALPRALEAQESSATQAGPHPALPGEALIGLWAVDTSFGPELRGELELRRTGGQWHASIGGHELTFAAPSDSVRFLVPGGAGEFRGALAGKRGVAGFWIQPAGPTTGQAYATPLVLAPRGRERWRGVVTPLEETFSVYLTVARRRDSSLAGVFRNPERNSLGAWLRFSIAVAGDSVRFAARPGEDQPVIALAAAFDSTRRTLTIPWPGLERTLVLTPREPDSAPRLVPRLPRDARYRYKAPAGDDDGWRTARASSVGMDEAALARIVQQIAGSDFLHPRSPLIHSLLVARRGRLVLEEYFFGYDRDTPHDTRSAGKTFASVMVGAAMLAGAPISPDSPVYGLLAARGPFANPDPRKAQVTVGHLMTHTSGLACDDNDTASPGNEETMQSQAAQPDWWKYTLDLPMVHDPGSRYAYCSAGMNLVGAALTDATGTWLPALFDRTVATPLGFGRWHFNLMPTLEGYQGGGVRLRPRDLLKLGQAYVDGGLWRGQRIVPQDWVARSTAPLVRTSERSSDGYAWHLHTLESGGGAWREYEANGNGGQLLIVVPDLELVVVFTAGNYGHGGVWTAFRNEIVPRGIIAAITDR
jgi:CubicO group peptidase (beta-lactamase class C family)